MAAAPFAGHTSLVKFPLTSITRPALCCMRWVPGLQRRLAHRLPLVCLSPSRASGMLHSIHVLLPLHRPRGPARPISCPFRRLGSLDSRRRRHPRRLRVNKNGLSPVKKAHAALAAAKAFRQQQNKPSIWLSPPPRPRKSYLVALTSGQDPTTIRPPPVLRPPPIPTRENRRARNADRWAHYRAAYLAAKTPASRKE